MARGTGQRHVFELEAGGHAAQHEPTAAHVAAADEMRRERHAFPEDRQQHVHILAGRNATEQHHLAVGTDGGEQRRAACSSGRRYAAFLTSISAPANARKDCSVTGVSAARRPAFCVITSTPPATTGSPGSGGRANRRA